MSGPDTCHHRVSQMLQSEMGLLWNYAVAEGFQLGDVADAGVGDPPFG